MGNKGNMHLHPQPFYVPGNAFHVWDLGFGPPKKDKSSLARS